MNERHWRKAIKQVNGQISKIRPAGNCKNTMPMTDESWAKVVTLRERMGFKKEEA